MVDLAALTEECLGLELLTLLGEEHGVGDLAPMILDAANWDHDGAAPRFQGLHEALLDWSCDDSSLQDFLERFAKFLSTVPMEALSSEEVESLISSSITPLQEGAAARHQMEQVLRLLSELLSDPGMSADTFHDELGSFVDSVVDLPNYRLSKAVQLQTELATLEGMTPVMPKLEGVCTELERDSDGALHPIGAWPRACPRALVSSTSAGRPAPSGKRLVRVIYLTML